MASSLGIAFVQLLALARWQHVRCTAACLVTLACGCTQVDVVTLDRQGAVLPCAGEGPNSAYCEDFEAATLRGDGTYGLDANGNARVVPDSVRGGSVASFSLPGGATGGRAMLVSGDVPEASRVTARYFLKLENVPTTDTLLFEQLRVYPEPTYNVELFSNVGSLFVKEILPSASPPAEHVPDVPFSLPSDWLSVQHLVDFDAGTSQVIIDGITRATVALSPELKRGRTIVGVGIVFVGSTEARSVRVDDVVVDAD